MTRPDQRVRWSKKERSLLYGWEREKPTSILLAHFFEGITMGDAYSVGLRHRAPRPEDNRTLAQELEARGYDLTTLRFSIRKKAQP
jgi:hypothetical protein